MALDRMAALMTGEAAAATEMPWHLLDAEHTAALRTTIARRYAPATTNRMLAALRGVLKEAWRLGLMDAEAYHHATRLKNVPWANTPRGRTLSDLEIVLLFQACARDPSPAGVRDTALLTVLYAGGLRRSEVVALDVSDYDASSGALTIRSAQGSRERTVYAKDQAARVLDQWIALRGPTPGPLFVPINKGSKILVGERRMNDQSIYQVLAKRGEQAGHNQTPEPRRQEVLHHHRKGALSGRRNGFAIRSNDGAQCGYLPAPG